MKLVLISDLIVFGNDIALSLFKTNNEENYVLACALNDDDFFGKNVSQDELFSYLKGKVDLRSIFLNGNGTLYLLKYGNETEAEPYSGIINESFLPDEGVFSIDHTQLYSVKWKV